MTDESRSEVRQAETGLGLPAGIRACLFDMDGVLTETAALHAEAWKRMFDSFLSARARSTGQPFVPFDLVRDYDLYVDGKPRNDGTRSFLSSRHIELPEGTSRDPASADTVHGLGVRKNDLLLGLLREKGVEAFPGSVRYVHAVRDAGLRTAVVSSSRNCHDVLVAAHLAELFDVRIDGVVAAERHLAGKPAPDTYLAAARALATAPSQAVVYEDALSGVAAGRAGHFGFVVGVDRVGQAEELRRDGADVVVRDLAELLPADDVTEDSSSRREVPAPP
jgi:beta-phosphoglucomutase family hydrolase